MAAYIKTLKDASGVDIIYPQTKASAVFTDDNKTVELALQEKMDTQTGTQGQLLGFIANNVVGAVNAPDSKSYYNRQYNGTLETSGWVKQSDSLYYKQVTITGMTSSQYPIVMPVWTNNRTNEQSAWNSLNAEVESFDGYVRFYAKTPITTAVGFVLLFGNV